MLVIQSKGVHPSFDNFILQGSVSESSIEKDLFLLNINTNLKTKTNKKRVTETATLLKDRNVIILQNLGVLSI